MNPIEQLSASGTHREVGLLIGRRFGKKIHRFLDNYDLLQERLLPFHRGPAGHEYYQAFLALHQTHYPDYVAELEGIAQGAERPFDELFLVNLSIFRTANPPDRAATLCTALFDLDSRRLRMYSSHPGRDPHQHLTFHFAS